MDRYAYEIIGGILIFVSSVVSEAMPRKWRVLLWTVFALLAIGYTGVGIHLDKQGALKEAEDRKERKAELEGVRRDMTNILTSFSGLLPIVASLNSQIAILQREIEAARGKHDPRVVADLQTRANTEQQVSQGVSNQLLVAMEPRVAQQLREYNQDWSKADGKEIIRNADYLRQVMVRFLPEQTDEDRTVATTFSQALANNFHNWNQLTIANYLDALVKRVVPSAPSLSVTFQ
jgi:hypothetical protein